MCMRLYIPYRMGRTYAPRIVTSFDHYSIYSTYGYHNNIYIIIIIIISEKKVQANNENCLLWCLHTNIAYARARLAPLAFENISSVT